MKVSVVLLSDVANLGRTGDVISVSRGHAENFLIPQGLARRATGDALARLSQEKAATVRRESRERAHAEVVREAIEQASIAITKKAGPDGKLYGSVTAREVADAIREQCGVIVDKKRVELTDGTKEIGTLQAFVTLHAGVVATVSIAVVPE